MHAYGWLYMPCMQVRIAQAAKARNPGSLTAAVGDMCIFLEKGTNPLWSRVRMDNDGRVGFISASRLEEINVEVMLDPSDDEAMSDPSGDEAVRRPSPSPSPSLSPSALTLNPHPHPHPHP